MIEDVGRKFEYFLGEKTIGEESFSDRQGK